MAHIRTGERLRSLREHHGISRKEAARRAGISRHTLAAYERGRPVPEAVAACLARSYGISPGELVPSRSPSRLEVRDGSLVAGEARRSLPPQASPDDVLDHYLGLIRDVRGATESDDLPLRDADLDALADFLGGTPKAIERRLVELIQCSKEEARALQRAILRRRLVAPAAGFILGIGGLGSATALKADAPAHSIESEERARTVDLAPAPPAADPADPPPPSGDTNRDGEPITRSGSGEGTDWAEVIDPVVITPDGG